MTTGSLGLRSSGSYGSLQQFQNISVAIQTTPPIPPRKPPKMFKEKEGLFVWICKVAPRKKVGMLLLCAVSAAVFVWVLYVGKGLVSYLLNCVSRFPQLIQSCSLALPFAYSLHHSILIILVYFDPTEQLYDYSFKLVEV